MHCVQACMQMLLHHYAREVPSFAELDKITGHAGPGKLTWLTQALLWLETQGFRVVLVENLDYVQFAKYGESYLKKIWDKETFSIQKKYSDLKMEKGAAGRLIRSGIITKDRRMSLADVRRMHGQGYFTMLSINPHVLNGFDGYGSHLVVIRGFGTRTVQLLDPDHSGTRRVSYAALRRSISDEYKPDFNAIFIKSRSDL